MYSVCLAVIFAAILLFASIPASARNIRVGLLVTGEIQVSSTAGLILETGVGEDIITRDIRDLVIGVNPPPIKEVVVPTAVPTIEKKIPKVSVWRVQAAASTDKKSLEKLAEKIKGKFNGKMPVQVVNMDEYYKIWVGGQYNSLSAAQKGAETLAQAGYNGLLLEISVIQQFSKVKQPVISGKDRSRQAEEGVKQDGIYIYQSGSNVSKKVNDILRVSATENGTIIVQPTNGQESSHAYRGSLEIIQMGPDKMRIINVLPIEDYLCSVMGVDMAPEWPLEAFKAKAIAARSWTHRSLGRYAADGYDVTCGAHDQLYLGAESELPKSLTAVNNTAGEVLVDLKEKIINAVYHMCCGGHTVDNEAVWPGSALSYLRGVPDFLNNDTFIFFPMSNQQLEKWLKKSPDTFCNYKRDKGKFRWRKVLESEDLEVRINRIKQIGMISNLAPISRAKSGHITRLLVTGSHGSVELSPEYKIRKVLGGISLLPSSLFIVEKKRGKFVLYGGGNGHGVGMCLQGAAGMASEGALYTDILAHYYSGAKLIVRNN